MESIIKLYILGLRHRHAQESHRLGTLYISSHHITRVINNINKNNNNNNNNNDKNLNKLITIVDI